jgi:hypothetical protein
MSARLPVAAALAAAFVALGCGPGSVNPDQTVINYRQVGACNGWLEGNVVHSAGPNAAYVIFKVSSINNEKSSKDFSFDPERLYVPSSGARVDTDLSLPLGPFELISTTISHNKLVGLNGYAGAIVQTGTTSGAVEANQTSYFLSYEPASGDPAILLAKENAQQTTWALTEDCRAIQLQ